MVIRDQDLMNPEATPPPGGKGVPTVVIRDREGDAINTGDGTGKPAKDLSVNFVPVAFPDCTPAKIANQAMESNSCGGCLNASAITYLNLQILMDGVPQILGVVGGGWSSDHAKGRPEKPHPVGGPRRFGARRTNGVSFQRAAGRHEGDSDYAQREYGARWGK